MSDIVERLKQRPCCFCSGDCSEANPPVSYCPKKEDKEAANEIERLRVALGALRSLLQGMIDTPCPTPVQWKLIGSKAKELDAALGKEKP